MQVTGFSNSEEKAVDKINVSLKALGTLATQSHSPFYVHVPSDCSLAPPWQQDMG